MLNRYYVVTRLVKEGGETKEKIWYIFRNRRTAMQCYSRHKSMGFAHRLVTLVTGEGFEVEREHEVPYDEIRATLERYFVETNGDVVRVSRTEAEARRYYENALGTRETPIAVVLGRVQIEGQNCKQLTEVWNEDIKGWVVRQ